ncbi:DEAD/DEAH box helicase [Agathobacter rectalis]|jgi:type III restriction enzyme|uniref:Restriction endonuclease n=1 Tax=Agathobacter rectalis TaxID=39491 RepID=A0A3E4M7R3_9FIRM|nr:DEAD/DEAH box helicase family protein [Agathobacter rectalis]RGK45739.1 restriction endonuclease [Agathobacter rectalis]RGT77020.1 restriction endonuclease [Agathobacter rectalis]RGT82178.1 restriction endonuclease [Agathobacter rectalis]
MELKNYQIQVIRDLERFLELLIEKQSISSAYSALWNGKGVNVGIDGMPPYNSELAGVPQVCFKVPTGGGKTFLAANSIKPIFDSMPHIHPKAVVWLVPSDAILTQTYRTLTDKNHDYRKKIDVDFGNKVEIYSKQQLLNGQNFNPTSVSDNLSVFVLSYDSFRTSKKDGRKAYQENGSLLPFVRFKQDSGSLLEDTDETALIQVIRKLNPVVIVDESHHATSKLSKEMLQNFNPSFVLDLTATPKNGSNIISFVDARQLKAENMVKLPVIVYNRKSQEDVFVSAISLRRKLENEAVEEQKNGGRYIRPIVLFQAQPRTNDDSTTYDKIKHILIDMGIPESEIAIKTADRDELKNIDLSSHDCSIRYIITVNALKEGWDCPFAYILATVANRTSSIDVEQILGRILRLPNTRKNEREVLNLSYVITSSNAFYATLDKVVAGLNAAGFTSKDYRIDDYVEQDTEFPVEQASNIQTELKLDNDVTDDTSNVSDEIDSLNVDFVREQISPFVNNENMESQSQSEVNNAVTDMLDHAKTQNELYWKDFEETEEEYVPVPPEVGNKMKHYKVNQLYVSEAGQIEIPQFMIETGRSLFSEHEHQVLTKENLYAGFSLLDKDTVIDFDSIDSEIARVDIDDSDAMPKAWKLQGFDSQNVKQWFDEQPSDRKMRLCKDMIIKKLSKNNAINDRDLEVYVDRIIQNLTEDQLTDMEQTPGIYVLKINKKVNSLLNEYAKRMFYELVEQDKISCQPSYKLPKEISPIETIASIPKSLYNEEEKFDNEYERKVVMELSSLNNIKWWHRNMARKGFAINGAVNAYPDLMVRTESGKLLLIETKGDQLENSESREKAETGAKWAEMAGRMYKYYMVFETKNPGYNGAYSYEEFMRIVKEL